MKAIERRLRAIENPAVGLLLPDPGLHVDENERREILDRARRKNLGKKCGFALPIGVEFDELVDHFL